MDSIKYADEQMVYVAAKFPQLGDDLSIIRLTILEAYRAGRETIYDKSHTQLIDIFIRKMQRNMNHESINEINEFRRINRGISAIADYLDYKLYADSEGALRIWGKDHIGEWEETHECKGRDISMWLEYYDERLGYEFKAISDSEIGGLIVG
jgi:hypothetical protein